MFNRKKKSHGGCCDMEIVEEGASCCPAGSPGEHPSAGEVESGVVLVAVMGPGCKKCHQLHENALEATEHMTIPVHVDYVTDPVALANAGIMSTPTLLVNGKVVSQGKVLSVAEIEGLVRQDG